MANELQVPYGTTGRTVYFVLRNAVGGVWNGSAFVTYNAANYATYKITAAEQGAAGFYVGTMPAAAAGSYGVEARDQAGGSPAESDAVIGAGQIEWDGSAVVPLASRLATSGYTAPDNATIASIAGYVDTEVAAIKAVTDQFTFSAGRVQANAVSVSDKTGYSLSAAGLDGVTVEVGLNARQALSIATAAAAGVLAGAAGTGVTIAAAGVPATTRISATVDSSGNRSAVTLSPPA